MTTELLLSVVTPERSIVKDLAVSSVILPGELGQLNVLPGHTNLVTTLRHGTFGYRVGEEWQVAFLSAGFAQIYGGKVTVLAETVEMAQELDVARAESELAQANSQLKTLKVGSPEYAAQAEIKAMTEAKLKAAQNKIH
ncbi:MAG: ATP synthase F1 subunit epsilon [Bdellovibrionota bacterium]